MKKAARSLHIHDRLEIYHLEAYFGVKTRTAQKYRKRILDFCDHRRSGMLFLSDLADYDNLESQKLIMLMEHLLTS